MTIGRESYVLRLAVAVRSMIDNLGAGRSLDIKIVEDGVSERSKDRLLRSWDLSRTNVEWLDAELGGRLKLPTAGRLTPVYLARIFCTSYVPSHWDRLICLDPDVLVLSDLGRLWDRNLGEHHALATRDPFIPMLSHSDGLSKWRSAGLPGNAPYMNAAVMLLNLVRWRQEEMPQAATDFAERFGDSVRYGQDVMNAILVGRWGELDGRWQVHPRLVRRRRIARRIFDSENCQRMAHDPWIYHFGGRLKPWEYRARQHADALFYEYLDRTDWRGWRPPSSLKGLFYRLYDSPLRDWLYPLELRAGACYRAKVGVRRRQQHSTS